MTPFVLLLSTFACLCREYTGETDLTIGVPVAAGALFPFGGLLISPIWASAAMTLSSLSVIGNALRLRRLSL